ncbi:IS5 family transposase [Streptomyces anulatus]|nr:IS5 family transposase [Streptomyces anulatus]MCX4486633.1 IS5 family transposase [Streptomyces anulatus]
MRGARRVQREVRRNGPRAISAPRSGPTQRAALEPLLPKGARAGRPPVWPRRRSIDGMRFRVRTGVPWRDMPVEQGPWGRVYDLFRRWQRDGTWQRILTRLQSLADAKGAIVWDLSVDSTVCRAHQHAAGARKRGDPQKEPPGGVHAEPGDHGLGRSRGGFTTKLHLSVEQGQKPMAIVVTAGQRGDSPQFEPVLEKVRVPRIGRGRPRIRPHRVRADRAQPPVTWPFPLVSGHTRRVPPAHAEPSGVALAEEAGLLPVRRLPLDPPGQSPVYVVATSSSALSRS